MSDELLQKKFSIYNGKKTVYADIRLLAEYKKYVSAFNGDVAESLLNTSGMGTEYSNGVLSAALEILMKQEIEEGKIIHEKMNNGDFLKAIGHAID